MKTKPAHQITIHKLNDRGNGEGTYHVDDSSSPSTLREAEVPFTCPGDVVLAELGPKKKGLRQGRLLEILTPSPDRTPPRCIHFSVCGGCRLQHLPYENQLQFKESYVKNLFHDWLDTAQFSPILAADSPWNYRNKMEFSFSQNKAGEKFLGLMMARGRVVDLQECHLVHPWFVETLKAVRTWWASTSLSAYHPYKDTGALRTLTLREGFNSGDRIVFLTVSGNPDYALHKSDIEGFVKAVQQAATPANAESHLGISLRIHQAIKGQPTEFFEMPLKGADYARETLQVGSVALDFQISPAAFFQPNPKQAEKLFTRAIEMAGIKKDAVVYDLFCGTGTLGICAAPFAKQVLGIEWIPEAVYDARANAAANGLENTTFLEGDVYTLLREIIDTERFSLPDLVFIDPPRAGLGEKAIAALLELAPPTLVYISCNPKTQAADLKSLTQKYRVEEIQPVDQFPQTPHIENIVLLKLL